MEILFVEDSLSDAGLAVHALRNGGVQHRMTLVTTGEEAIEVLTRAGRFKYAPRPDLILLDLGLPMMSGQDFLNRIREDDDLRHLPVVVMTMSDDEANRLHCELQQVDGYVTKPVDMPKFLELVRKLKRFWHDDVTLPNA